jgi:hypothetical protein
MSVSTLFRVGGDPYSGLADAVALIPGRQLRALATDILRFLVALDRKDLLNELITDRFLAELTGWSERTIQRGLHALHRVLEEQGCAIINRVRQHGRRVITFIRGLASSGTRPFVPPSALPLPEKDKNTTTEEGSSSSLENAPENPGEGKPTVDPELVDRACKLIPGEHGADPGKVADAVATSGYVAWNGEVVTGADAVRYALDQVEYLNSRASRDGKLKVFSWGKVLGILRNRQKEQWAPPAAEVVAAPVAPLAEPLPHHQPVSRLTAEDVAELVALCRNPVPALATIARSNLREAIAAGQVAPELVATIPAELLKDPKPRAP